MKPTSTRFSPFASSTLAVTALGVCLAAPARAEEVHVAAPPAQPHDDVSTLNGQLVRVGEQNEYRHSYRRWNVALNPIAAVVGFYGASVSGAFNQHVAVRLEGDFYKPAGGDHTGWELDAGAPIYFRKMYTGFFLEPGVMVRWNVDDNDGYVAGPQVLAGYHWSWDSGFNVAVAFGAGRNFVSGTENQPAPDVFANGYLRFGYSF